MKKVVLFLMVVIIICFQDNSKSNSEKYPDWLYKLYIDKSDFYSKKITHFEHINDSVSYCIVQRNDGVSTRKYLSTQVNRKHKSSVIIFYASDHDGSYPVSRAWNYKKSGNKSFIVDFNIVYIPDSLYTLNEYGLIKDKSFFDFEGVLITDRSVFRIDISELGYIFVKNVKLFDRHILNLFYGRDQITDSPCFK